MAPTWRYVPFVALICASARLELCRKRAGILIHRSGRPCRDRFHFLSSEPERGSGS